MSAGIALRPAVAADVAALARILGDWVRDTPWMPVLHDRDEDRGFISGLVQRGGVTIAHAGEGPLGFLDLEGGQINALYVAAGHRGRGIGGALLDHAKAQTRPLQLWTFQANVAARDFYAAHGFEEIDRTDGATTEENLPDILLEWR